MKKIRLISLLSILLLAGFSGCQNGGVNFGIPYTASFTVPSMIGVSLPFSFPIPEQSTNSEQEFENHDTKSKWVKHINLESLTATIVNPVGQDFSFLKSAHIYIKADGLDEAELAWADNISDSVGGTLQFDESGADFAEYIKQPKFSLRSEVVVDKAIFFDVTIELNMGFDVVANAPLFQ